MQLALDKATNDLFKPKGGGVTRVSDGRFVVQQVQSKLRTMLGEFALNPTVGWVNFDDYIKNPDLYGLELRARQVILSTQGVLTVDTINLTLGNDRVLYLTFTATTIYGGIDLTVPWSS